MFSVGYEEKRESLRMMKTELSALREAHGHYHAEYLIGIVDELLDLDLWDLDENYEIVHDMKKREYFDNGFNWLVNSYLKYVKDPDSCESQYAPYYED